MSVVMFLPERLRAQARHVLVAEKDLLTAQSWEDLNSIILETAVSAVILDPGADGVMNVNAVAGLLRAYPSLPVVAYVVLTPESFNAITQLSREGLENVLLYRFEDEPDRFRASLERARVNPLAEQVLRALRPQLERMPSKLSRAIADMFESPHRYLRALDLALKAEMSGVRLYRDFEAAGLRSPRKILIAAKLLRGYGYLGDPGYSIRDVAKKIGYRGPRIFAEHITDVFGMKPTRVRSHLAPDAAVRQLLEWLARDERKSPIRQRRALKPAPQELSG